MMKYEKVLATSNWNIDYMDSEMIKHSIAFSFKIDVTEELQGKHLEEGTNTITQGMLDPGFLKLIVDHFSTHMKVTVINVNIYNNYDAQRVHRSVIGIPA